MAMAKTDVRSIRFTTQHKLAAGMTDFDFDITPKLFEKHPNPNHAKLVIVGICTGRQQLAGYIRNQKDFRVRGVPNPLYEQGILATDWTYNDIHILASYGDGHVTSTPWIVNTSEDVKFNFVTFIKPFFDGMVTINWELFDNHVNPLAVREVLGTRDMGKDSVGFSETLF